MALTPEDVVNKRFQPTKFREGYDQDEVDDFLDEVVVELRRLSQENEELRQRLIASDSRMNELQRSALQPQSQSAFAAPSQPAFAAPPAAPEPVVVAAPAFADANASDPASTNNLLQLARRLHEEHVREGVEKRDALIAEGHATAARVVSEAESSQRAHLGSLDQERQRLEHRIDELRSFEREYRQKLKGYIEGQLRELDSVNMIAVGSSAQVQDQTQAPTEGPAQQAANPVAAAPAPSPFVAPAGNYPAPPAPAAAPSSYPGFGGN
jgi:DivIVA domain-containing protein